MGTHRARSRFVVEKCVKKKYQKLKKEKRTPNLLRDSYSNPLQNLAYCMLISKLPKSLVYFLFAQKGKETFRGKKAIVNNLKQVS